MFQHQIDGMIQVKHLRHINPHLFCATEIGNDSRIGMYGEVVAI